MMLVKAVVRFVAKEAAMRAAMRAVSAAKEGVSALAEGASGDDARDRALKAFIGPKVVEKADALLKGVVELAKENHRINELNRIWQADYLTALMFGRPLPVPPKGAYWVVGRNIHVDPEWLAEHYGRFVH